MKNIEFYCFPSPNCLKVSIMLEETGLPYEVREVDIFAGGQFEQGFLAVSPNNKVPALVDPGADVRLFESGAILEYLAFKSGAFLPLSKQWIVKSWLHWQMSGLGPMAGQAHHFRKFAPEVVPYGVKRYTDETNRLYGVLDRRLEGRDFIVDEPSIADFAAWPWVRHHEWQGQDLGDFPNVRRWFQNIRTRPGVERALALHEERMAPREAYRNLYGQTAASTATAAEKSRDGDPS